MTIQSGSGTVRETGEEFGYEIRFLRPRDVPLVMDLHRVVIANLPRPLVLYERDEAFFERCTRDRGCVVGAVSEGRMIAYAALYRPAMGEENYGEDLALSARQLACVGHLAGSAVQPEYRGNGLQRRLVELRTAFAEEQGVRHMCGEVLPMNIISIANHLARGYTLEADKIDGVGLTCYVLHRRLGAPRPSADPSTVVERYARDVEACCAELQAGRWGYEVVRLGGEPHIRFAHFSTS